MALSEIRHSQSLCMGGSAVSSDVIPDLKAVLHTGKAFFRKKKQPIPVDLTTRDWGRRVKDAVQATYLYRPTGNSISIKYVICLVLPLSLAQSIWCESCHQCQECAY